MSKSTFLACIIIWLLSFIPHTITATTPTTAYCILTSSTRPVSYLAETLIPLVHQKVDMESIKIIDATKATDRIDANCSISRPFFPTLIPCEARQIALDVVVALRTCAVQATTTQWILLIEDDAQACPGAIATLENTLHSLSDAHTHTLFARFSKFGRVIAFPIANVKLYTDAVLDYLYEIPYDTLLFLAAGKWGPGQPYTHPVNLFRHIGQMSKAAVITQYDDICGERL